MYPYVVLFGTTVKHDYAFLLQVSQAPMPFEAKMLFNEQVPGAYFQGYVFVPTHAEALQVLADMGFDDGTQIEI